MATRTILIFLPEEACSVALVGPFHEGLSLKPETRAAIERAAASSLGRVCHFTEAEARDAHDYFRSSASVLAGLGDARGVLVCAQARDNIGHALYIAGIQN